MTIEAKDWIAIYAAVISTIVFLWNVSLSRAKYTVTLIPGIHGSDDDVESGVYLTIRNPSSHKIHITAVSLLYPYKKVTFIDKLKFVFKYKSIRRYIHWVHTSHIFDDIKTGLPVAIEPRNSHQIFIPDPKLHEMLSDAVEKRFAAEIQDALWRSKYTSPYEMHPRI